MMPVEAFLMRRIFWVVLLLSSLAFAYGVTCPLHDYSTCYDTGEQATENARVHKFHCTCGDDVWARAY